MTADRQTGRICIDRRNVIGDITPRFYGGLMEIIGEVFTGGLNAELIRNRKFANVTDIEGDGTPINWKPTVPREQRQPCEYVTSYNSIAPGAVWSCCMLSFGTEPVKRGIGQGHIPVEAGRRYILTFYLRRGGGELNELTVSLKDEQGEHFYEPREIGTAQNERWRKYTCNIEFPRTTDAAELRIQLEGRGFNYICCVSMLPEENVEGLRADMVERLKDMGLKLLRFPGGCAAEGYDWRQGVGPKDLRPCWLNLAWKNHDDMDTGTDEIGRLAEVLGGEAHMTVNISTLTEVEAAQWVEYCNGPPDSRWGGVRAANGHPEPYNVKVWGLGNEADSPGFPCEHTPEDYAERCNRFIAAMRKVDPSIEFVLVGHESQPNSPHPEWDNILFKHIREPYEFHSLHRYTGIPAPKELDGLDATPDDLAMACAAEPLHLETAVKGVAERLNAGLPEDRPLPKVYLEEWGLLTGKDWDTDPEALSDAYNLRGALFVAGVLNMLHRNCDKAGAGNVVFPTGIEFIFRDGNNVHVLPAATAMGLHQRFAGTTSYKPEVECAGYTNKALGSISSREDVPFLDVAASADDDAKRLSIMVVNRHPGDALRATISLAGFDIGKRARAYQVAHVTGFGDVSDWYDKPAYDSVGQRDRLTVPAVWCAPKLRKTPRTEVEGLAPFPLDAEFTYEFPPHSFTVIVCELK